MDAMTKNAQLYSELGYFEVEFPLKNMPTEAVF